MLQLGFLVSNAAIEGDAENAGPNLQGWKRQDKRVWNAKWLRIESSV